MSGETVSKANYEAMANSEFEYRRNFHRMEAERDAMKKALFEAQETFVTIWNQHPNMHMAQDAHVKIQVLLNSLAASR